MKSLAEQIDEAVKTARGLSGEITEARNAGKDTAELETRRDASIADADKLKERLESDNAAEARMRDQEAFLNASDTPIPPAPDAALPRDAVSQELAARHTWQEAIIREQALTPTGRRVVETVRRLVGPVEGRAKEGPEVGPAFEKYLRRVAREGFGDAERRVLQVVSDTAGGYTVPSDRRPEVFQRVAESAKILQRTTQIPTSSDTVEWLRIKEHATASLASIYANGFVGSWVSETPGGDDGEAEPTFGRMEIRIRDARAIARLSNKLIADSAFDVMAFLASAGAANLGLVFDAGILNGTGTGNQPSGILNDPDIVQVDVSGTTADTISNIVTDRGSADKLLALDYALPEQYLEGAVYILRRSVELAIRKLVDAQNRYLWEPGFANSPNELFGKPVLNSSFMPDQGTDANKVILYGNLSEVITAIRSDITVFVNPFRLGHVEQTEFLLGGRMGVGVPNPDAFRIGKV